MKNDLLLWQLADSAFPTGGFAHSGGLEAAHQLGLVSDADSLEPFLENALAQVKRGVACFAHEAWTDPDEFAAIDRDCDLFLSNHVANRGSRAQGQALLSSASRAFSSEIADASLARWSVAVRRDRSPTHLAPVFGLVSRAIGVSLVQMNDLFWFIHLRGYISAAVRLGIVGPMQAQRMQANVAMRLSSSGPQLGRQSGRAAWQINPMLDLMQMMQDRLYCRLFQS